MSSYNLKDSKGKKLQPQNVSTFTRMLGQTFTIKGIPAHPANWMLGPLPPL